MIIHDVEQGSEDWHLLRATIPTASNFSRIITPQGKESKSITPFAYEIAVNRLLGKQACDDFEGNQWTERGNELEPKASELYSLITDNPVKVVGFITNDEKTAGASPDRLVGTNGLLEIKCPKPSNHLANFLCQKVDMKYYPQVQGQLWIAEREWCDWISYHEEMQPVIIRVNRDDEFIKTLSELIEKTENLINETVAKATKIMEI